MYEYIPVGIVITIITTMDPDVGESSQLLYTLRADTTNNANLFKIDQLTSMVRLGTDGASVW